MEPRPAQRAPPEAHNRAMINTRDRILRIRPDQRRYNNPVAGPNQDRPGAAHGGYGGADDRMCDADVAVDDVSANASSSEETCSSDYSSDNEGSDFERSRTPLFWQFPDTGPLSEREGGALPEVEDTHNRTTPEASARGFSMPSLQQGLSVLTGWTGANYLEFRGGAGALNDFPSGRCLPIDGGSLFGTPVVSKVASMSGVVGSGAVPSPFASQSNTGRPQPRSPVTYNYVKGARSRRASAGADGCVDSDGSPYSQQQYQRFSLTRDTPAGVYNTDSAAAAAGVGGDTHINHNTTSATQRNTMDSGGKNSGSGGGALPPPPPPAQQQRRRRVSLVRGDGTSTTRQQQQQQQHAMGVPSVFVSPRGREGYTGAAADPGSGGGGADLRRNPVDTTGPTSNAAKRTATATRSSYAEKSSVQKEKSRLPPADALTKQNLEKLLGVGVTGDNRGGGGDGRKRNPRQPSGAEEQPSMSTPSTVAAAPLDRRKSQEAEDEQKKKKKASATAGVNINTTHEAKQTLVAAPHEEESAVASHIPRIWSTRPPPAPHPTTNTAVAQRRQQTSSKYTNETQINVAKDQNTQGGGGTAKCTTAASSSANPMPATTNVKKNGVNSSSPPPPQLPAWMPHLSFPHERTAAAVAPTKPTLKPTTTNRTTSTRETPPPAAAAFAKPKSPQDAIKPIIGSCTQAKKTTAATAATNAAPAQRTQGLNSAATAAPAPRPSAVNKPVASSKNTDTAKDSGDVAAAVDKKMTNAMNSANARKQSQDAPTAPTQAQPAQQQQPQQKQQPTFKAAVTPSPSLKPLAPAKGQTTTVGLASTEEKTNSSHPLPLTSSCKAKMSTAAAATSSGGTSVGDGGKNIGAQRMTARVLSPPTPLASAFVIPAARRTGAVGLCRQDSTATTNDSERLRGGGGGSVCDGASAATQTMRDSVNSRLCTQASSASPYAASLANTHAYNTPNTCCYSPLETTMPYAATTNASTTASTNSTYGIHKHATEMFVVVPEGGTTVAEAIARLGGTGRSTPNTTPSPPLPPVSGLEGRNNCSTTGGTAAAPPETSSSLKPSNVTHVGASSSGDKAVSKKTTKSWQQEQLPVLPSPLTVTNHPSSAPAAVAIPPRRDPLEHPAEVEQRRRAEAGSKKDTTARSNQKTTTTAAAAAAAAQTPPSMQARSSMPTHVKPQQPSAAQLRDGETARKVAEAKLQAAALLERKRASLNGPHRKNDGTSTGNSSGRETKSTIEHVRSGTGDVTPHTTAVPVALRTNSDALLRSPVMSALISETKTHVSESHANAASPPRRRKGKGEVEEDEDHVKSPRQTALQANKTPAEQPIQSLGPLQHTVEAGIILPPRKRIARPPRARRSGSSNSSNNNSTGDGATADASVQPNSSGSSIKTKVITMTWDPTILPTSDHNNSSKEQQQRDSLCRHSQDRRSSFPHENSRTLPPTEGRVVSATATEHDAQHNTRVEASRPVASSSFPFRAAALQTDNNESNDVNAATELGLITTTNTRSYASAAATTPAATADFELNTTEISENTTTVSQTRRRLRARRSTHRAPLAMTDISHYLPGSLPENSSLHLPSYGSAAGYMASLSNHRGNFLPTTTAAAAATATTTTAGGERGYPRLDIASAATAASTTTTSSGSRPHSRATTFAAGRTLPYSSASSPQPQQSCGTHARENASGNAFNLNDGGYRDTHDNANNRTAPVVGNTSLLTSGGGAPSSSPTPYVPRQLCGRGNDSGRGSTITAGATRGGNLSYTSGTTLPPLVHSAPKEEGCTGGRSHEGW